MCIMTKICVVIIKWHIKCIKMQCIKMANERKTTIIGTVCDRYKNNFI